MTKQEKIEAVKRLLLQHPFSSFTIPDNCPGDGWDGSLGEDGAYVLGNNHFEGE